MMVQPYQCQLIYRSYKCIFIEIEFPKGVAIPSAEEQDEAEEEKSEVEEGWADMNLDVFLKE